jgi:uncharacterized protein YbaP (TraB family)
MKKHFLMLLPRLVVTLVAGLLPISGSAAEPVHPVKPLLWKVDGPGMAEASYLFGTIHLGDKEQTRFLTTALDYMQRNREAGTDPKKVAVAVYLSGDIEKVEALAMDWMAQLTDGNDGPLIAKPTKRILNDRDVIMADYIDATLKKRLGEVHFFAAGAGHFAANGGVRHYARRHVRARRRSSPSVCRIPHNCRSTAANRPATDP